MPGHDIIVVGASVGGIEALIQLVRRLPKDLPAAIFVVLHIGPNGVSVLPEILNRQGTLPTIHPRDGHPIEGGYIYVALPDNHLLVNHGFIRHEHGPKENGHRPAIDTLFRSAALSYGHRVVGVVLSGVLDDGSGGLLDVKRRGGVTIVQDPEDALFPGMPRSAIENAPVDYVLPAPEIAPVLVRLAREPITPEGPPPEPADLEAEAETVLLSESPLRRAGRPGWASPFSCPECGDALQELNEDRLVRFRCGIGHVFSLESLSAAQAEVLESALWTTLRSLEDKARLSRRMASQARERGHPLGAARYNEMAQNAEQQADYVRRAITTNQAMSTAELSETQEVVDEIEETGAE